MKSYSLFLLPLVILTLTNCGISNEEHDKLQTKHDNLVKEVDRLKLVIDEYENGEERLEALVIKSYDEKNYDESLNYIELLKEKHPASKRNEEFKSLKTTIEKELESIRLALEAEEKEKIRIANLNNTGMWNVSYYVDDFGQATKEGYIRNSSLIEGRFSNSATTNSDLNVKLLISNSSDISIMLYEYAGNNPVKAYSSTGYSVLVLDSDGGKHNLNATNYSDRLSLDTSSSRKLHSILMKGGRIQITIREKRNSINVYNFTVHNATYYDNAYRKLQEK